MTLTVLLRRWNPTLLNRKAQVRCVPWILEASCSMDPAAHRPLNTPEQSGPNHLNSEPGHWHPPLQQPAHPHHMHQKTVVNAAHSRCIQGYYLLLLVLLLAAINKSWLRKSKPLKHTLKGIQTLFCILMCKDITVFIHAHAIPDILSGTITHQWKHCTILNITKTWIFYKEARVKWGSVKTEMLWLHLFVPVT